MGSPKNRKKEAEKHSAPQKTALEEQLEAEAAAELPDPNAAAAESRADGEQPDRIEELEAQLVRLQADFENVRKRAQRERIELFDRAAQELIEELLPVLDHFEMGLETAIRHETDAAVTDGFKMVYDQMQKALAKFKLSPMDALGRTFDPHTQEAVSHLPSEEYAENTVMAQTRRGYMLGEKLLRPAQVVVSSGAPKQEGQAE
jgi:molecular chaperone GrpE